MPRVKTLKEKVKKIVNPDVENILLDSLKLYFVNNIYVLEKIYELVENNNKIKLALIDYFVTIYSKKKSICINNTKDENNDCEFYINDEYKNGLKSFTKKLFDPFKRKKKIEFNYNNISFTTTTGQLNFLKWVIENNILTYIEKNFNVIYNNHQEYINLKKKKLTKNK